jgi:hypothetical protein
VIYWFLKCALSNATCTNRYVVVIDDGREVRCDESQEHFWQMPAADGPAVVHLFKIHPGLNETSDVHPLIGDALHPVTGDALNKKHNGKTRTIAFRLPPVSGESEPTHETDAVGGCTS